MGRAGGIAGWAAVVALVSGVPAPAGATDAATVAVPLTVVIDPARIGTRSLAAVATRAPLAGDGVQLHVRVSEVARAGSNDWWVTATTDAAPAKLLRRTGQGADRLYTGTHAANVRLPPPLSASGAVRVDLIQ